MGNGRWEGAMSKVRSDLVLNDRMSLLKCLVSREQIFVEMFDLLDELISLRLNSFDLTLEMIRFTLDLLDLVSTQHIHVLLRIRANDTRFAHSNQKENFFVFQLFNSLQVTSKFFLMDLFQREQLEQKLVLKVRIHLFESIKPFMDRLLLLNESYFHGRCLFSQVVTWLNDLFIDRIFSR